MEDCIFCKIIKGEIPSYKVYEDETTMAFLDISPVNHGHTLVVSKQHYANLEEIPTNELQQLIITVKKVGQAIKNGLEVEGYNVCENNDPVAGQLIPHIHFHVVPRHENDGIKMWPQEPYPEGKAAEVLEKIKIN
ncbi:HIT family protein [Patescibacteria group bacterium]|nr:HIT family protein [Patescibacteria group bacterium]